MFMKYTKVNKQHNHFTVMAVLHRNKGCYVIKTFLFYLPDKMRRNFTHAFLYDNMQIHFFNDCHRKIGLHLKKRLLGWEVTFQRNSSSLLLYYFRQSQPCCFLVNEERKTL